MNRREFLKTASLLGAALAFRVDDAWASARDWRERRDLYPEGVASGDPSHDSVLLWTRRPPVNGDAAKRLTLEVAEDDQFTRVVATTRVKISAASDWTCRVLAAGLAPARVYWYRFTDERGNGSRVGRTLTAPAENDPRPVRFAFVSCQDANTGAQNAYRRMIFEDERAPEHEQLGFVLHLGDFVYEMVWYPEDRTRGYYDRKIFDVVRYPRGEKISDFHVPVDVNDYRALYQGYLHDPEIQDARARWPFVCIWDNHEYSWQGFQGMQVFGGEVRPAQTRKVAANQAWWEYQPSRVIKSSGTSLETFDPPTVADAPIATFDAHGLGQEKNNLTAIASLIAYRTARYGANLELFVTDQHSFRSPDATDVPEGDQFYDKSFPYFIPEEVYEVLDAGQSYDGGHPPATIKFAGKDIHNSRAGQPAPSMLGVEQQAWFVSRLKASRAPWKVWGNSLATLAKRADPQNLPAGSPAWGGTGFASLGGGDWSTLMSARNEILDVVRDAGITGFTIVAGDRHAFWAGTPSRSLPPKPFDPVGIEFVTGSISAPGMLESAEYQLKKDVPLRGMYLADRPGAVKPDPTVNMMMLRGVRSALEYANSGDLEKARALTNPDVSPHLTFVDVGGHGYATVRVAPDLLETEFVCIARPVERSTAPDGGPLRYRVRHRAPLWKAGDRPKLDVRVLEGAPDLSL